MRTVDRTPAAPAEVTRITSTRSVSLRFYVTELWRRRDLVRVLTARLLKRQYEMNVVGFAWWMLEPLSLTFVFVLVFDFIFRAQVPDFPLFVMSGVLAWKWLSSTIISSMQTMRANASLVTDVYFPRALLPIVENVEGLMHFLIGLIILPPFMLASGVRPTLQLLWLPAIMAVQFVFTLGICLFLTVWGLYYRNLSGLVNNLLRLWLYLTPIIWPVSRLTYPKARPTLSFLVKLNPLTGIMDGYHRVILGELVPAKPHAVPTIWKVSGPDWTLAYAAAFGVVALFAGAWYFRHREQQFGKLV
ncbi:MAG: ABC transporter permease [Acidobacteria bacterium]|nr:ABC transporter permease [Acidobacteriota bacterium]